MNPALLPHESSTLPHTNPSDVAKEQLKQVITEAAGEKEFPDSSSDFRAIKASYHRGRCISVSISREGVFGEWLILLEGSGLLKDQKFVDEILSRTPIKRIAEPEEVSSLVTFLCLPGASYITGQIEQYKAEIKKLQASEAEIKALSVNYAALLKEKEFDDEKESVPFFFVTILVSLAALDCKACYKDME
ncbi:hypothetical protein ACSQ67_014719 [Phaseolus vulgaris]